MPFGGETSGSVAKCWLFSQAISIQGEIQKVNIMVSSQIRDFKIQWSDRNENVKKKSRFNKWNNTFACASCFFIYFFVVTAWLRRENAEIPHFMENVNKQQRNLNSRSELGYGPLEFNFRRVRLHFTKYVGRNNNYCEKDWKNANWLLSNILVSITSLDLKVPSDIWGTTSGTAY